MSDMDDKKIDDALAAWPAIGGHADDAAAAKTMNKIRANFPPKSKLLLSDDALVAAPLPATKEEWVEEKAAPKNPETEKSSRIDVPIGRASSIPPPSSGVSRSERSQNAADADARPKVEAGMGQVERQRERTSFKDLAKLAATPPPSSVNPSSAKVAIPAPVSSTGDSGVVDLQAAALSDPQAAERAKSTPLASGSLFDEEGPQSVPPPSMSGAHSAAGPLSAVQSVPQQIDPYSPASVRPSAPPSLGSTLASAGPHSAVAALGAQKKVEEKKSSAVLPILGGLVAVSAIAAGALLFVKMHKAAPVAAAQPVAQAAAQDQAAQPAQQAKPDQPATNDTPQVVAQNDTQNVAPVAQGAVAKSGKPVAHAAGVKPSASKSSGGGGNALADAMEKDTASTPPAAPPQAATNATAPAGGASADLQNAMKTAVGPSDSSGGDTKAAPSGPKFAPGSVPQRPSQGALASAIGRVLPDARSCLGPDDGVSYATIVFESGGSAQNVTLSGFAANKPAGACITTALKKANVGPFAEPTYSAKVTVRP